MDSNKRLHYVDIARGIAMFLIVLGHSISLNSTHSFPIYRIIYFINVPIFFVLSGYMFKIKERESFFDFIKKKFLRIMLPYFFWAFLFLVPYYIFGHDVADQLQPKSSFNILGQIGEIFYGNGTNNSLQQNAPLWFLPALFTTEVLFYFIIHIIKNRKMEIVIFAATLLIGFFCTFFARKIYLPWGLNSALTIGCFFYFGYLLKKWQIIEQLKTTRHSIYAIVICLLLCGIVICFNVPTNVSWRGYNYLNYFLTITSGFTSALAIILVSKLINKNKPIENVGRNTMGILIFHKIVIVIAQTKLGVFSKLLLNSNILLELCLAIIVSIITIIVSIIIGALIRKVFPILIGERKQRIGL